MGLIKRQYVCRVCHSWLRADEGTGFMFWWTCHRCRSRLAAEKRADVRTQPEAGWYVDPGNAGRERWWDGTEWTEHTR